MQAYLPRLAIALVLVGIYVLLAIALSHLFDVRAGEVAAWAAVVGVALHQASRLVKD